LYLSYEGNGVLKSQCFRFLSPAWMYFPFEELPNANREFPFLLKAANRSIDIK